MGITNCDYMLWQNSISIEQVTPTKSNYIVWTSKSCIVNLLTSSYKFP